MNTDEHGFPRSRVRQVVRIVLTGAVVVAVGVLLWPGEREPEYQGKKLSEWIRGTFRREAMAPGRAEREDAVRRIGTNALPFLVERIASADLPRATKMEVVVARANKRAGQVFENLRLRNLRRADEAAWAFAVLGDDARPATPQLIRLSRSTNWWVSLYAETALRASGSINTNQAGVVSGGRN